MFKFCFAFPMFILTMACPPLALAVVVVAIGAAIAKRVIANNTPEARRARDWYANV